MRVTIAKADLYRITMSSGRPNKLQYHKNMLPCALILQQQPEFETDLLIYPVTKVLQFAEEANEIYNSEDFHGPSLCIHARQFTTRLEDWWSSLSLHLSGTGKRLSTFVLHLK